ncbi:MAG: 16S rRNA (guanine(527)-N(7))-methyltransferase RsmG [Gammaproteobacteria bacterium]|nr:MAG: 16S rRNA (guanine(527)-N(7))-methyltransferase RsmG [Gammaproteobacteria bacterium]
MENAREILHKGMAQLGINTQTEPVYWEYLKLLKHWNRAYNLVASTDDDILVRRHLLDSLSVLQYVKPGHCLDVGTGAGLPGLPLAVTMPESEWVLLDSNGKKTRFCAQAVHELGLENVRVVQKRLEKYVPDVLFDSVISRAFSSAAKFVQLSGHLVASEGRQIAMKGQVSEDEKQEVIATGMRMKVFRLSVPGLDEQRHVMIIQNKDG